MAVTTNE